MFLPGESYEQRSLTGYSKWAHKELDMTVTNTFSFTFIILLGASKVVLLVKNPPAKVKDASYTGSVPGSGRLPWSRK